MYPEATVVRPCADRTPLEVAHDWREGLLQDLLAMSILVRTVNTRLDPDGGAEPLLGIVAGTLDQDIQAVRASIREIEALERAA
ncbi:MAG: hypothetical protein WC273_07005 [Dehalococcoidia bacterium]